MKKGSLTLGVIVVALVLLVGLSTYAYGTVSVTNSSPLYGLKASVESIEISRADDGLEAVNVHLKMADRRMAEAKYLAAVGDFKSSGKGLSFITSVYAQEAEGEVVAESELEISVTIEDAIEETQEAIDEAEEITDPVELDEALTEISEAQEEQVEDLLEVAETVGIDEEEVTDAVLEAIVETEENLEVVEETIVEVATAVETGDEEVVVELATDEDLEDDDSDGKHEARVNELLAEYEAKKSALEASLEGLSEEEKAKILAAIARKEVAFREAIASGNFARAQGLIKAATALQNRAKHFVRVGENKELREERKAEREERKVERKADREIKREERREEFKALREETRSELKDLNSQIMEADTKEEREDLREEKKEIKEETREEIKEKREEIKDEREEKREEIKVEREERRGSEIE